MKTQLLTNSRRFCAVAAVTLVLGGCGTSDVELNGKIFDWMGVSTAALSGSKKEPQLAPRQGLIVPPSTDRLPAPGSETETAVDNSWPQDPDQVKLQQAAVQAKTVDTYCRERDWYERAKPAEFNKITQNGTACTAFGSALNSAIEKPKAAPGQR